MAALTLILMPFAMLYKGFVVTILWGWFIVPHFEMEPLGIATAIGIVILLSLIKGGDISLNKLDENKEFVKFLISSTLVPTMALFMGWAVTWFM